MQIKTKVFFTCIKKGYFWKNLDFKSYCVQQSFLQSSILFVIIVTDQSDGDKM